jgi:calcineurin-like phosphoesterase family protein
MVKIYVISDTHFGHENSLKWLDNKGNKLRPFDTVEEMNNTMITNWNNTVKSEDHVYHIGDVVIKKEYLELVKQLNGHKRLVAGNHDIFDTSLYLEAGFDKICGARAFPGLQVILTHIPIHPDCIKEGWINVSGHLHSNNLDDKRYINVSVEQINYTPVLLEDILKQRRNETIN